MQPIITIFCAFSRTWTLDSWLESLAKVQHDPALTNLCFIIDFDRPYMAEILKRFALAGNYRSIDVQVNDEHDPNEVNVLVRRQRIAYVMNQSKRMVAQTDGVYVICLEDDTVFDSLPSFERLLAPMMSNPKVAFVEGVQCGRWGVKMIGAWVAIGTEELGVLQAETLLPDEGYQSITAGGFYGFATPKLMYINHDYYTSSTQPWGPDVNYGLWLQQLGYGCIIDWETVFGHRDHDMVLYPDSRVSKIKFIKDPTTGEWSRHDRDTISKV